MNYMALKIMRRRVAMQRTFSPTGGLKQLLAPQSRCSDFPTESSTSVSEASPTSILTSCSTNWSSLASWFLSFYEILWGRYYFAPAASKWINSSRFKSFYWKEVDSADFWENSYIASWPSLYILLSAVALTIPVVMFAWIPLLITPTEDSTKSPLSPTTIFLPMHAN